MPHHKVCKGHNYQGFFLQFWEKAPGQNWEKMIDLTSKLGEINDIEHNKGSKIYPQNQIILDCIMPGIPLKHKSLSINLTWVRVRATDRHCRKMRRNNKFGAKNINLATTIGERKIACKFFCLASESSPPAISH